MSRLTELRMTCFATVVMNVANHYFLAMKYCMYTLEPCIGQALARSTTPKPMGLAGYMFIHGDSGEYIKGYHQRFFGLLFSNKKNIIISKEKSIKQLCYPYSVA